VIDDGGNVYTQWTSAGTLQASGPTTTSLTSGAPVAAPGQVVTFTATVTAAGAPASAGSVEFLDSTTGTELGIVPVQNGSAALPFTFDTLTSGDAIVATYIPTSGVLEPSSGSLELSIAQPQPVPPTIVSAQLSAFARKHNAKGKPVGKPVALIELTFSEAMNTATIDNAGEYRVAWESIEKVKRKARTVFHSVPIRFLPSASTATVVALETSVPLEKFSKGGEVMIVSSALLQNAAGVALSGPTTFTLRRK
jgi:hypothetical protein